MSHAAHARSRPADEAFSAFPNSTSFAAPRGLRLHRPRDERPETDETQVRNLIVLFQRNPDQDHQSERVRYEGYHICWPDGEAVSVSTRRFCQQGCRLLGLGRHMRNKNEQLVELGLHPVAGLDAPLTRVPRGMRTRRFYLERQANQGRLYFFNGSPTEIEFDVHHDDRRLLSWFGLPGLRHQERLWFDLSAKTLG